MPSVKSRSREVLTNSPHTTTEEILSKGCKHRDGHPSNKTFYTVAVNTVDELMGQGFSIKEIRDEAQKLQQKYDAKDEGKEELRPCDQTVLFRLVYHIIREPFLICRAGI